MTALAFDHDRSDARTRLASRYDQLYARARNCYDEAPPDDEAPPAQLLGAEAALDRIRHLMHGRPWTDYTFENIADTLRQTGRWVDATWNDAPRFRVTYEDADGEVMLDELFHSVTEALDAYTGNLAAPPRGVGRMVLWELGTGGRWTLMESDHLDDARGRVA